MILAESMNWPEAAVQIAMWAALAVFLWAIFRN